jgi:hypothetical protein
MRAHLAWALVLSGFGVTWSACGGRDVGDVGSGGSDAGSDGGSDGAPAWSTCDGPGTCTLAGVGCCAPCGKPTIDDVEAVSRDPAMLDAFRASTCGDPHPACPKCATAIEPNLAAFCTDARCRKLDVREDDVSACATDADCALRYASCCEPCVADPYDLVAVRKDQLAAFRDQLCAPGSSCPACVAAYPTDLVAACGPSGHCEVRPGGACPADAPAQGAACSLDGLACEYGLDVRTSCRTHATCTGGAWQVAIAGCPPLPGPGQAGCPAQPDAQGTCASDGLVCDLGGGAVCACGACLGPCSTEPRWVCASPPTTPGCPSVAPALGSACDADALVCVYGVCGTSTSAGRRCASGRWQDEPVACPL